MGTARLKLGGIILVGWSLVHDIKYSLPIEGLQHMEMLFSISHTHLYRLYRA